MGVHDQIKAAFQDIIAPELHALRGDIRVLDQKVDGLDRKIDEVDGRLTIEIDSVRTEVAGESGGEGTRIDTVNTTLNARIDGVNARIDGVDSRIEGLGRELRTAIDIRERLAALEARHPA